MQVWNVDPPVLLTVGGIVFREGRGGQCRCPITCVWYGFNLHTKDEGGSRGHERKREETLHRPNGNNQWSSEHGNLKALKLVF